MLTRKILRAFENFPNPQEAACEFLNVIVLEKICPELETRIDLLQPPKRPKRRFSQFSSAPIYERLKKRRMSVPFNVQQIQHGSQNVLEEASVFSSSPQNAALSPSEDTDHFESRLLFGK